MDQLSTATGRLFAGSGVSDSKATYLSVFPIVLHHCIHPYASIDMYACNSVYTRQVPHCARAAVYANGGIFNASAVAILQSHQ